MRIVCFSHINLLLLCYVFLPLELTFYQVNTFFPLLGELVSTSWAISIITWYQMNTFFHFKGISCLPFLGNDMWLSHQSNFELSYEESLLFQHKSIAPMIYILTFVNNLIPVKYHSTSRELVSTSWEISNCYLLPDKYTFPISGELASPSCEISISTIYQINTFFHFWGTSYFHFWGTDMWPSHQPIFELSYEESLLFQHKSTAPMIYILTFENNLLPGKYFSHFWENRFHLLGNLKITLYQINTFFHFWGTSCFLFWEMTCDLVTNRFLELS